MSFIPDTGVMHFPSLQPAVRQYVRMESSGARDGTGQNGWYYPVLFVNSFWQLKTHMMPVNSTVTTLPIHINLNHLSNWKFGLIASIDEGVKQTARNAANGQPPPGGGDGNEFEMIKEVLLDTNIYLQVGYQPLQEQEEQRRNIRPLYPRECLHASCYLPVPDGQQ